MSITRTGWKIVCPDGKERHYPYVNHGDALFDAGHLAREGCTRDVPIGSAWLDGNHASENARRAALAARYGACPEGEHKVEPHVFVPAPPTAQA